MTQCCKNCKFYNPERNPDTGRVLPSQGGQCKYVVEWPKLPDSMLQWRKNTVMWRSKMWPYNGENCSVFEPIKGKGRNHKKQSGKTQLPFNE